MGKISRFIAQIKCKLTGKSIVTPEWLRRAGAIVGEDVELLGVKCSAKDATCLEIGSHVTLVGTHILTHDASTKRFLGNDTVRIGRVKIGNNVFVGLDTIILPNVVVGDNVVVGAGSVVTRDIPSGSVVAGNPARVISTIEKFTEKHREKVASGENVFVDIDRLKMSAEERKTLNEKLNSSYGYIMDGTKND